MDRKVASGTDRKINPVSQSAIDRKVATGTDRKINPVYKHLREQAQAVNTRLHAEFEADGDLRKNLMDRNRGVRCFMTRQDIVSDEGIEALIAKYRRPGVTTQLHTSTDTGVQSALDDLDELYAETVVALYAPQSSPLGTVYGGIPHELTDLALRSTLIWQLNAPAMHLSQSDQLCQLHATTSFYVPSVEVRRWGYEDDFEAYDEGDSKNLNVVLMADVPCILEYWEEIGRPEVNISNLINNKLITPMLMTLRQNENREKLKDPLPPIRHVVIGDMGLNFAEHGISTLLAQRLQSLLKQFDSCFDSVTICGPSRAMMHVRTHMGLVNRAK